MFFGIALFVACTPQEAITPTPTEPPKPPRIRVHLPKIDDTITKADFKGCIPKAAGMGGTIYTSLSPAAWTEGQVESLRDITFDASANAILASPEEFDRLAARNDAQHKHENRISKFVGWALGLAPHGLDYTGVFGGEGTQLISGFYDPRTKDMVVRSDGTINDELVVLTHELVHAGTDDVFGLRDAKPGRIFDETELALSSVYEGDASVVELMFLATRVDQKLLDRAIKDHFQSPKERFKIERQAGVPYFMMHHFVFPYAWGSAFVCDIYRERGWKGVNALYRDPPEWSSHILFPGRYLDREKPIDPSAPPEPGEPWKLRSSRPLGAADLKALFEAPADEPRRALSRPVARVAAWDGGRLWLWVSKKGVIDDEGIVAVRLVERKGFEGVLCASMHQWYRRTYFNSEKKVTADGTVAYSDRQQHAVIACDGRDIRIGMAPDSELAAKLAQA